MTEYVEKFRYVASRSAPPSAPSDSRTSTSARSATLACARCATSVADAVGSSAAAPAASETQRDARLRRERPRLHVLAVGDLERRHLVPRARRLEQLPLKALRQHHQAVHLARRHAVLQRERLVRNVHELEGVSRPRRERT